MNTKEFSELLLTKKNKAGYISEKDLYSLAFNLGYSTPYFNANLSCLRNMNVLSKKLKIDDENVYFFNEIEYNKLIGKEKEKAVKWSLLKKKKIIIMRV